MANRFQVGSVIEIHGLRARDDLNGQPAIVVGYVEESGRFQCELTSASKMVLLKPDNIIEGAVTSCHSALALSLVRLARESSQWKLKSLLNGKKLCEGCDCHLNDAKLAPCVCIAGLGASTLSGLNLPADLLASLPAELQASMNLGGASPSVGTRTICFDGGVSAPVQLPESAMVDEDVMQPRHKMRGATTQHVWLPTESRVPFYICLPALVYIHVYSPRGPSVRCFYTPRCACWFRASTEAGRKARATLFSLPIFTHLLPAESIKHSPCV